MLILALPVAREWKLLVHGDRVEGEVVEMKKYEPGEEVLFRIASFRAVIEFQYQDRTFLVPGPENLEYEIGEKVPLIIDPEDTDDFIIATLSGFYFQSRSIALIIVLILWIAIYTTIVQMQKGKTYRKKQVRR